MSYQTNTFISSEKVVPSYDKRISICLETNGYSFSIISAHNELLTFGVVTFDGCICMTEAVNMVRSVWSEHNITPLDFGRKELVVVSPQVVLVPDELYEPGNDRKYLDPLVEMPIGMAVFSDYMESQKAWAIFSATTNLVSAFKIVMPGLKVRCQYSKLVSKELTARSRMRNLMVLYLRQGMLDTVVFCNSKLQLANSFLCANTNEVIYQSVELMKQLKIDESLLDVLVCGTVDSESYGEIRQFFPKVELYCGNPLDKDIEALQHLHTYRHVLVLS